MGLTHYWDRPTEFDTTAFEAASRDCKSFAATVQLPLAGFEGMGEPMFESDVILFNGAAAESCEPFEIHAVEFDRRGRNRFTRHCKTEARPYDLMVKVALIVLRHHLGDAIRVTSDEKVEGWGKARKLCQVALGYGADFQLTK